MFKNVCSIFQNCLITKVSLFQLIKRGFLKISTIQSYRTSFLDVGWASVYQGLKNAAFTVVCLCTLSKTPTSSPPITFKSKLNFCWSWWKRKCLNDVEWLNHNFSTCKIGRNSLTLFSTLMFVSLSLTCMYKNMRNINASSWFRIRNPQFCNSSSFEESYSHYHH